MDTHGQFARPRGSRQTELRYASGESWLPVRPKATSVKKASGNSVSAAMVATTRRFRPEASVPVARTVHVRLWSTGVLVAVMSKFEPPTVKFSV